MGHILEKAIRIVVTTFETYPVLTTERLFYNGQSTPDGARKVYEGVILCLPLRTASLKIHLWTATLCQGNHGTKYKPRNTNEDGDAVYETRKCRDDSYWHQSLRRTYSIAINLTRRQHLLTIIATML